MPRQEKIFAQTLHISVFKKVKKSIFEWFPDYLLEHQKNVQENLFESSVTKAVILWYTS
jgi:hypothetical protein